MIFSVLQLVVASLYAQEPTYGDPDFYLIDSLDLSKLGSADSTLINGSLQEYHQSTSFPSKMTILDSMITGMMDNRWEDYNQLLKIKVVEQLAKDSVTDRKILLGLLISAKGNEGYTYLMKQEFPEALEILQQTMQLSKEIGDKKRMAEGHVNIGYIFEKIGNREEAINHYREALELFKELQDKAGQAQNINNIAVLYFAQRKYEEALEMFLKSLAIYDALNMKSNLGTTQRNVGMCYSELGVHKTADVFIRKSLTLATEIGDLHGICFAKQKLAENFLSQANVDSAGKYLLEAEQLLNKINDKEAEINISRDLHRYFKKKGDYKNALEHHERYLRFIQQIQGDKNKRDLMRLEVELEYEKQLELQHAMEQAEADKRVAVEKEIEARQRIVIYLTIGSLVIVLMLLMVIIRRLRISRKQTQVIADQKQKVDDAYEALQQNNEEILSQRDQIESQKVKLTSQNKELKASQKQLLEGMNYARTIQSNLLINNDETLAKFFEDSFVFNRPKDVVSGDFYWVRQVDELIYIAVADCTGHGVSGALLTIVCSRILDETISKEKYTKANELLDAVHREVVSELKRPDQSMDGMDISLAILSNNKTHISFAGAHNSGILIRDKELIRLEADRRSIGFVFQGQENQAFTEVSMGIRKGDELYLFTDGYYDQFGGEKNLKYFSANLEKLFLSMTGLSPEEQRKRLVNEFITWKGSNDQIDDVCVVGIKF